MITEVCLYEKICDDIKTLIDTGKLALKDKVPSVSDIREKYKVSHITALRALKELLSENYIEFTKGKGYFVSFHNEQSQPKVKNALGCLIRPLWKYNLTDNYYNEIFCGMQHEAQRRRLDLIQPSSVYCLNSLPPHPDGIKEVRESALRIADNVDGFIVDDRIPDNTIGEIIEKTSKPLVLIDRVSKLNADTVTADNAGGSAQAAMMALGKGYKNFIICRDGGAMMTYNNMTRVDSFIDELNKHGSVNMDTVENCNMEPWETTRGRVLHLLENKKNEPTLIFASASIARYLCDILHDEGFKIGEEIGIVCFEATGYAKLRKPYITSININTHEIGEKAIDILCGRINFSNSSAKTNHIIPVMFSMGDTL
jgi:DNA-binding LacI/PurR family transcriptional regulator